MGGGKFLTPIGGHVTLLWPWPKFH